jgi:hypothetical protein
MLKTVRDAAKRQAITVEKYVEVALSWEELTATERSTREERLSIMDTLRELAESHPDDVLHPRDIVAQVGLKQCQADRAFVRHHYTKFRLAAHPQAAE